MDPTLPPRTFSTCASRTPATRASITSGNFGFLIRGYGFFQLDIAEDPWPRGFPARLDPGQRMLVDILTEGDDVPEAQPLSLDISWDGSWHEDTVHMQQHLTIRETRRD